MRRLQILSYSLTLTLLLSASPPRALAQDPCASFRWDVSKERALFASQTHPQAAGGDRKSATVVEPDRLYELQLLPQDRVVFSAPPAKTTPSAGTYAGLAVLRISASGGYRISVDLPLWIDVAANGKLVRAKDYEGQQSCNAPHKIVVFELDPAQPLLLQFSGASRSSLRLTVTRAPGSP
jgi:hypothetical protein